MTTREIYGILLLFLFHFTVCNAKADKIQVSIHYFTSSEIKQDEFPAESVEIDSMALKNLLSDRMQQLYARGYLAAFYDIQHKSAGKLMVLFYTSKRYLLANLRPGDLDDEMLRRVGYKEKFFHNTPFSYQEIGSLLEKLLIFSENNGYPFASVNLDSLLIQDQNISATLIYQSGPLIHFDSLKIEGVDNLKGSFIMSYLGIYRGKPFNQKLVKAIPQKIDRLEYVQLASSPEVIFKAGKSNIVLKLIRKKSDQIDGIVGLLPNANDQKKMIVTGQARLELHNLFSAGKHLKFEWQRLNIGSQLLNIDYLNPNLLRSPLNVGVGFHLLKQDSNFVNRDFLLKISLLPSSKAMLAFTSEFRTSRLLESPTNLNPDQSPAALDFNLNYYGLDYALYNFNDPIFPTSGFGFSVNGMAGQKKIVKNPAIPDDVYGDIRPSSAQYKLEFKLENYWRMQKNWVILTAANGGFLSSHNLFKNDLFRLGGLNSLRGFNENYFYASQFAIGKVEVRTVFSDNSYFMFFYDQGIVKNTILDESTDFPFGTGAGFDLSTNAGIFSFVLALGKSKSQEFGFNFAKIHFGYINRF